MSSDKRPTTSHSFGCTVNSIRFMAMTNNNNNNNNKFVERHSAVASEALAEQVS